MAPKSAEAPLKRKRSKIPEKASKRAKADTSSDADDNEDEKRQEEILQLETDILQSKKNYNNIAVLLEHCKDQKDPEFAIFVSVSLCRVFLRLLASGGLSRKPGQSERETVVLQWLKARLSEYKKLLVAALARDYSASTALTLSMRLLKAETQIATDKSEIVFPKSFLKDIVGAIVQSGFEDVQGEFCEKYMGEYADVRYYTFQALR